MYSFTLQFIIMVSLATIIYLVAKTIPRIDENAVLNRSNRSFLEKFFSKLPLEKIDLMFDNLLEKILRKFKIAVMKIDNTLTRKLSDFKPTVTSEKDLRPNIFENPNSGREDIKREGDSK
ncbi:MAG: hypothetical protein ACYC3G_01425 [Minisyncoccota bacterium]